MPDFLDKFRLHPYGDIFWLGGEVRPGSVRDSLWRAGYLIERLARGRVIGEGTRVLVVGAGISGMSAATHALGAGAYVAHTERHPSSHSPFENCVVRKICPTTADFPQDHFAVQKFPHSRAEFSLFEWSADRASNVFTQIRDQFDAYRLAADENFEWHTDVEIERLDQRAGGNVKAKISGVPEATFDVAILATGIGELRRRVPDGSKFQGYAYYDNDPVFGSDPSANAGKRVLLVGGGDGSLVDFVRLVTGVYDITPVLETLAPRLATRSQIEQLARSMWAEYDSGPTDLHRSYDRLQMNMIGLIDGLWQDEAVRAEVRRMMRLAPDRRPSVQICLECCHFGFAYLANRVLAQLIARHLAEDRSVENGGLYPFRIAATVANVAPATLDHDCLVTDNNRGDCAAHPHLVYFSTKFCPSRQMSEYLEARHRIPEPSFQTYTDDVSGPVEFDRVLVRTGAKHFDQNESPDDNLLGLPPNILAAFRRKGARWHVPEFYTS